ncbi:MAG: hypothetical protein FWE07_05650 [Turicibacter sp.]|nr:hypothetical protein [Turicibacter sp.]
MSKREMVHEPHQIEIDGDVGKLTAYTKKGKPVVALIDAVDVEKLEAFEHWRAVWNTEFDCQMIESKTFKDGYAMRLPVAAAILDCSPNAPIRHLNGELLDNRRANLEIFDVKAQPNEIEVVGDNVQIKLRDRYGRDVGVALIDADDLDFVVNEQHVWLKKQRSSGQPYVVNQQGLLLAHHVLRVTEGFAHYINKNPLDNRRKNLEIK